MKILNTSIKTLFLIVVMLLPVIFQARTNEPQDFNEPDGFLVDVLSNTAVLNEGANEKGLGGQGNLHSVNMLDFDVEFTQSQTESCLGGCVDFWIGKESDQTLYYVNFEAIINEDTLSIQESIFKWYYMRVCFEDGDSMLYDEESHTLTAGINEGDVFKLKLLTIENESFQKVINEAREVLISGDLNIQIPEEQNFCLIDGKYFLNTNEYKHFFTSDTSNMVQWYNYNLSPINYSPIKLNGYGYNQLYVKVSNGLCESKEIEFKFKVYDTPEINDYSDKGYCGNYVFYYDVQGNDITENAGFYEGPGGTGTKYELGDTLFYGQHTVYVYDINGECADEDTFSLDLLEPIDIQLEGYDADYFGFHQYCDSMIMPEFTGTGISDGLFYIRGIAGDTFYPGDILKGYGTTVFEVRDKNKYCKDVLTFNVIGWPYVKYNMPDTIGGCGQVILPPINSSNFWVEGVYDLDEEEGGEYYEVGDTITENITLYLSAQSFTCTGMQKIEIVVSDPVNYTEMPDQVVCDSFLLPPIEMEPSNNPKYYSKPYGEGEEYEAGDYITHSGTFYVYDQNIGSKYCEVNDAFEIDLIPTLTSGKSDTFNFCQGSLVDLKEYLSEKADTVGLFIDVEETGLLTESILDANTSLNEIKIDYQVKNQCGEETANFVIQIVAELDAGNNDTLVYCDQQTIDLQEVFQGDKGGHFYDVGYNSIEQTLSLALNESPSHHVYYVLDSIQDCPADTASVLIHILPLPEFTSINDLIECNQYILPVVTGDNLTGNQVYTTEVNGKGDTIAVGTVITESQLLYVYDEQQCVGSDSLQITIHESYDLTQEVALCANETIQVGATEYSLSNPSGTESLQTIYNCDSLIHVSIIPKPNDTTEIKQTLCFGQSIMIGSKVFDQSNPKGEVSFTPIQTNVCDSIVQVDLTFADASYNNDNVGVEICKTDTLLVNGKKYYFGNDSGADTLQTVGGCDSIINVQLTFYQEIEGSYTPTVCGNESIQYQGVFYDKDHPSGTAILKGQSVHGCDSVVQVNIIIDPLEEGEIAMSLCGDEQFTYNGTVYDTTNVAGEEYVNFDNEGCDSLMHIIITPLEESTYVFDKVICQDEEHTINGTVYNKFNLTGTEVLEGQSVNGCDSIVEVNLTVDDDKIKLYTDFYCPDYEIEINGVVYSASNPKGEEVINNGVNECDSVILIDMKFHTVTDGLIEEVICEGGTIEINGVEYSESNQSGSFVSKTSNGCDSTTQVKVSFEPATAEIEFDQADCEDQEARFTIKDVSFTGSPYKIKKGENPLEELEIPTTFTTNEVGAYTFEILGDNGCIVEAMYIINEIEQVENTLPAIVEIVDGDSFELNVEIPEGATIEWTPSDSLSCMDCPNPLASPSETTIYTYKVITDDMCEFTGSIEIRVLEKEVKIYVPNSFSPNGDGQNEVFGLYSTDDVVYDLLIFDRWGNRIAEYEKLMANQNMGWNGRFKGEELNTGVYIYLIRIYDEVNQSEVQERIQGDVLLLR